LPLCVLFRFEMRAFTALACISWMFSLFSYSRTEHTSASEDYKREFCVIIMFCLREIILHLQRCQRASIKTGIFTVWLSYEITRICIEYMLVVLTLNFFLFEPKFVFDKAVKLATIGFTSGMTADLACQMSSCLCQDYNILLLSKRDILYTGNVE
jgi:hypothetical protein